MLSGPPRWFRQLELLTWKAQRRRLRRDRRAGLQRRVAQDHLHGRDLHRLRKLGGMLSDAVKGLSADTALGFWKSLGQ